MQRFGYKTLLPLVKPIGHKAIVKLESLEHEINSGFISEIRLQYRNE